MEIKRYKVAKLDGHAAVTKDAMHVILTPREFRSIFTLLTWINFDDIKSVDARAKEDADRLHYQMSLWAATGNMGDEG